MSEERTPEGAGEIAPLFLSEEAIQKIAAMYRMGDGKPDPKELKAILE